MIKTIYLIRHGETIHNRENNRLSGVTEVLLTNKGEEQCRSLSKFFEAKKIEDIYTSPLSRAMDSAKIIFPRQVEEFLIAQNLIEINYGQYEGFDRSENSKDTIIAQWDAAPGNLTFPGGDNVGEHAERVYGAFTQLCAQSNGSVIAFVSHRTTIRLIIAKILNLDLNFFRIVPCSNCSVTQLEFSEKLGLKLITISAGLEYTDSERF